MFILCSSTYCTVVKHKSINWKDKITMYKTRQVWKKRKTKHKMKEKFKRGRQTKKVEERQKKEKKNWRSRLVCAIKEEGAVTCELKVPRSILYFFFFFQNWGWAWSYAGFANAGFPWSLFLFSFLVVSLWRVICCWTDLLLG